MVVIVILVVSREGRKRHRVVWDILGPLFCPMSASLKIASVVLKANTVKPENQKILSNKNIMMRSSFTTVKHRFWLGMELSMRRGFARQTVAAVANSVPEDTENNEKISSGNSNPSAEARVR